MIKLSDYLNYLNSEVIQAKKRSDEESMKIAKEYAEHEYLKFFSAPRFSMPSVKLSIPIKISELKSEKKYQFSMDKNLFLNEVNDRINEVNHEKKINIPFLREATLASKKFNEEIKKLETKNNKYLINITSVPTLNRINSIA